MGFLGSGARKAIKHSSFRFPFWLLSPQQRQALLSLYAVCRVVDDAVDTAPTPEAAKSALTIWEQELRAVFRGLPTHELAEDLQRVHNRYGFDPAWMDALLDAFRLDVEGYMLRPTLAVLEHYCNGVAGSIGLMSMRIFGCRGETAERFAVTLGTALQLTNILRDIRQDAASERIYLPQEWLDEAGLGHVTPKDILTSPQILYPVCVRVAAMAQAAYDEAETLARSLPLRQIAPALAMRDVYACYFRQLEKRQWKDGYFHSLRLSMRDKCGLLWKAGSYLAGIRRKESFSL